MLEIIIHFDSHTMHVTTDRYGKSREATLDEYLNCPFDSRALRPVDGWVISLSDGEYLLSDGGHPVLLSLDDLRAMGVSERLLKNSKRYTDT